MTLDALLARPAQAQDYPARTVKIVVPFPAGGTADVMPRIIAEWLSRKWGQSVIIEDRVGAGGNIGAEVVAKNGTTSQLTSAMFQMMANVKLQNAPYRGSAPALNDPEIQKRLANLSAESVGGSPADTAKYFAKETGRWKNVITSAHVTLD